MAGGRPFVCRCTAVRGSLCSRISCPMVNYVVKRVNLGGQTFWRGPQSKDKKRKEGLVTHEDLPSRCVDVEYAAVGSRRENGLIPAKRYKFCLCRDARARVDAWWTPGRDSIEAGRRGGGDAIDRSDARFPEGCPSRTGAHDQQPYSMLVPVFIFQDLQAEHGSVEASSVSGLPRTKLFIHQ